MVQYPKNVILQIKRYVEDPNSFPIIHSKALLYASLKPPKPEIHFEWEIKHKAS